MTTRSSERTARTRSSRNGGYDGIDGKGGADYLSGGEGNDTIWGGAGKDTISGNVGNDTMDGGSGPDWFSGWDGIDQVTYQDSLAPVTVTLDGTANDGAAGEGDNVVPGVEIVIGGQSGDDLTGDGSANWFYGGPGPDKLYGLGGNDMLDGQAGTDTADGGAAVDDCTGETLVNCEKGGGGGLPSATLTATPSSVSAGGNVSVTFGSVSAPTSTDWIGLYKPGDANTAPIAWKYDNSCTQVAGNSGLGSGSCSFTMPATAGTYELRLFANDGYSVLGEVRHGHRSGAQSTTLTATPSSVAAGGNVTVTFGNVSSPTSTDWIGLYKPGDANTSQLDWKYDNSCTQVAGNSGLSSGSCSFTMPATPGTYEFRLLANDGFTVIAKSGTITVS